MQPDRITAGKQRADDSPPGSLRTRLLLFTAALVVVPGVVLAVIAARSSSDSLERVIGQQLAREAGHTADRLSDLLLSELETLENFARQDLMREIRVADIDKRISAALSTLRDGSAVRRDYAVIGAAGSVVASSDPASIGTRPDWAPAAGETGVLRGPAADASGQTLLMAAAIPDPDAPERRLGTLVGRFDWRALTQVTAAVRDDLEAQGVAADVLLVGADGASIGGSAAAAGSPGARAPGLGAVAAGAGRRPDFAVDAASGMIVGRASLAPSLPDWKLLVLEPRSDALAPVRRASHRLAAAMAVALVAALGLATLAARRVVEPLSELTRAVRGLSRRGGPGDPVPVRTDDEVGQLASAFNEMAADLDRAQRELVEAEKFAFVGELAAGVAHEIRTALNVLGSSTRILERSLPAGGDPEAAELAEMIREEVARLAGVVNDLLTLSRGHPLALEPGPLSEPVFRAADFVAPQARDHGIEIARSAPPDEPLVWRDAELIHQVAVNLLVNAIQALGHGGCIEIVVLAAQDGMGGFEVRDDGRGIPEELRERIFQPFVTARDGGVGLGLTFVKRVVHDHHGNVSVSSEAGAGTRFRIELPLVEGER
jgi:signal transduction histidine kinase